MTFLSDSHLKKLLSSDSPPIKGVDLSGDLDCIDSPIQPCSIDLTVGRVLLPSTDNDFDPRRVKSVLKYDVPVGASVRIETAEMFALPSDLGAIVVAPARVTRRGILVADVGHIDPGFHGVIRLTLINFGRDAFCIEAGMPIATVLMFILQEAAEYGLRDRNGNQPYSHSVDDIQHLAVDFLNIDCRAKEIASSEAKKALGDSGWKYAMWQMGVPLLIGVASAYILDMLMFNSRLAALESQSKVYVEILDIENRVSEIKARIEALEPKRQ